MAVDWTALDANVVSEISLLLPSYRDFISFRATCKLWENAVPKENFRQAVSKVNSIPWLMLGPPNKVKDIGERRIYNISTKVSHKIVIPEMANRKCVSCNGWMITMSEDNFSMHLLHPLSRIQIKLPPIQSIENWSEILPRSHDNVKWRFVRKFALSADPSVGNKCSVMMIYGTADVVVACRVGEEVWTRVQTYSEVCIFDVIYHQGKFHMISYAGSIYACDPDQKEAEFVADFNKRYHRCLPFVGRLYLVECADSLLVVGRIMGFGQSRTSPLGLLFSTHGFFVYKVDMARGKFEKLKTLGDMAIFIGESTSMSVQVTTGAIRCDCIYFTDDNYAMYYDIHLGLCQDMGVYSLKDKDIQQHFGKSYCHYNPTAWLYLNK